MAPKTLLLGFMESLKKKVTIVYVLVAQLAINNIVI